MTNLSLVIVFETNIVEVANDLLGGSVLLDLAGGIETNHVTRVDLAGDFEDLFKSILFDRFFTFVGESNDEMYGRVSMVFFVVLRLSESGESQFPKQRVNSANDETNLDPDRLFVGSSDPRLEHFLVILSPGADWKFRDFNCRIVDASDSTGALVSFLVSSFNRSLKFEVAGISGRLAFDCKRLSTHAESSIPRMHRFHLFSLDLPLQVCNDIARVVVRYERTPTSSDTVGAVDENHWKNRNVPESTMLNKQV